MDRAIEALQYEIAALRRTREAPVEEMPAARKPFAAVRETLVRPPDSSSAPAKAPSPPPPPRANDRLRATIEHQFGGRAFVWLGGIALALSGFFLVKYSIDTGLLDEKVRVGLGTALGLALLTASRAVRSRPSIADGIRIAQALAGAGIAVLYGSFFAGTSLYHLFPAWLGFVCLAFVTLVALILSLRHGTPIAALGLLGGYATPLMVTENPMLRFCLPISLWCLAVSPH